jgi:hypothetical protein
MAKLDRAGIIALLDRLGAEDDATVLDAARTLHRQLSEAGTSWDELLRVDLNAATDTPSGQPDAAGDAASEISLDDPSSATDSAETARLIERLLARKGISSTLREDLDDLKRALTEGSLDASDHRYVRALAKRLGP